jgi:hypothetical protein
MKRITIIFLFILISVYSFSQSSWLGIDKEEVIKILGKDYFDSENSHYKSEVIKYFNYEFLDRPCQLVFTLNQNKVFITFYIFEKDTMNELLSLVMNTYGNPTSGKIPDCQWLTDEISISLFYYKTKTCLIFMDRKIVDKLGIK